MNGPYETPEAMINNILTEGVSKVFNDLAKLLDVEAGLGDALMTTRHNALRTDLNQVLDIDAGLGAVVAEASASSDVEIEHENSDTALNDQQANAAAENPKADVAKRQLVGTHATTHGSSGPPWERASARAAMVNFLDEEAKSAIELDAYVEAVGGRRPENFPHTQFHSPGNETAGREKPPNLFGRFLLRLINVVPGRCPPVERTKFYLVAATVLLNAAIAAYAVPAGMSVAYPGLHGIAKAGLAILGAATVGIMNALIVGGWLSPSMPTRYHIDPPSKSPPMPGPLRRLGILVPRLAFTIIIVFGLGLLLTLAANAGVIAKQAAVDAIINHNAAVPTAQIQADTTKLRAAQSQLAAAQKQQTSDENRASCELYGIPRVPGCSPLAGAGPSYRYYKEAATGADQNAVDNAQAQVNNLERKLSNARAALGNIKVAVSTPTGLSAANAEWNRYADSHGLTWIDRNLLYLLLFGISIVPLSMKLFGGITSYEAMVWENEWREAVQNSYRRRAEQARLSAYEGLYEMGADTWLSTRVRKLNAWLSFDADDPSGSISPSNSPRSSSDAAQAPTQKGGGQRTRRIIGRRRRNR